MKCFFWPFADRQSQVNSLEKFNWSERFSIEFNFDTTVDKANKLVYMLIKINTFFYKAWTWDIYSTITCLYFRFQRWTWFEKLSFWGYVMLKSSYCCCCSISRGWNTYWSMSTLRLTKFYFSYWEGISDYRIQDKCLFTFGRKQHRRIFIMLKISFYGKSVSWREHFRWQQVNMFFYA